MVDDRDLGRFAVRPGPACGGSIVVSHLTQVAGCALGRHQLCHAACRQFPRLYTLLQNILGLAIAVLLIAFHYVTAEPRRQA